MIREPEGIWQAAGDTNIDCRYAYRAENIRTERGLLASALGMRRAFPALGAPIGTLTRFVRRNRPDDPEVYVAAAGGCIYTYTAGAMGWVRRAEGMNSDKWSSVTYESTTSGTTVDLLIMSNEQDGMIAVYGNDLRVERKRLNIGADYAAVKFAVLGRYAERIWGTGDAAHPDVIFYSRPYDPFDWTREPDTPELGGGQIGQPTWDGEAFMALRSFSGCLLAIKPGTIFEIRGTDPSSFTITQTCGTDGPMEERTICTDRAGMLFLSQRGISLYDGSALRLVSRDAMYETMRMRMPGTEGLAAACVCGHIYYLALCVRKNENDVLAANNAVIEYDTERGTFMLRTGVRAASLFTIGGKVYYTQADAPYEVLEYGAKDEAMTENMSCLWETGWLDLDKGRIKNGFVLRFTAQADADDVPLSFTIITEKREKTKVCLIGRERKDYRVRIRNHGRRVRLRLGSEGSVGWSISGGIEMRYEMNEKE